MEEMCVCCVDVMYHKQNKIFKDKIYIPFENLIISVLIVKGGINCLKLSFHWSTLIRKPQISMYILTCDLVLSVVWWKQFRMFYSNCKWDICAGGDFFSPQAHYGAMRLTCELWRVTISMRLTQETWSLSLVPLRITHSSGSSQLTLELWKLVL
jgi:hypothetical protein